MYGNLYRWCPYLQRTFSFRTWVKSYGRDYATKYIRKNENDHSVEGMHEAATDLTRLSNLLLEQLEVIEDVFINLFIRWASEVYIDAMFSILSVSSNTSEERLSKIFTIKDVNLNFSELKLTLENELDEYETPEAFKKTIQKLRWKEKESDINTLKNEDHKKFFHLNILTTKLI